MAGRDNFTDATKTQIASRAGYICSHPTCGRMTIGPSDDRASGVTMVGIAAHIVDAAGSGVRSEPSWTSAQRKAASNGIWMCAIHGKWIDDNPSIATVAKLHEWKAAHEAEISAWVEHGFRGILKSWDRLSLLSHDQRETIRTALPNQHSIVRDDSRFHAALEVHGACFVTGDSGVGKSALVKTALDARYPEARQIWLGPEALQLALSEADRSKLELTAPLVDQLRTSTAARNILVLDAVERIDAATVDRLTRAVDTLREDRGRDSKGWDIVAIGQRAGFEFHLDPLTSSFGSALIEVDSVDQDSVRHALLGVPALAQHAYDDSFVSLLGNLRTLAWIIAAGPFLAGGETGRMAARTQIADRLWTFWTTGDVDLHSFMVGLARRDAEYERSVGLSELSATERAAWKNGRGRMPVILSSRNRIAFEHDLASDWARYQSLKEIADDVAEWAPLADRPLWVASLRLFGQFLLREPDPVSNGWDTAFAAAEKIGAQNAIDILLDALCLDPDADRYLSERSGMLLADDGKLLNRLLDRFMHIATQPQRSTEPELTDASFNLYAEAELRWPIWSAWPPLLRFLVAHIEEISRLGSRSVAKLCGFWLMKTPPLINGEPVAYRAGIAELAVETARTDQIASIAYNSYGGRSDESGLVFAAALAGAEDQLDLVSAFALEMARRRPVNTDTQAKIDAIKAEERKRRASVEQDRPQRRKTAPLSMSMLGYRKLPPWPMGPAGRLNEAFRTAVLKDHGLKALMMIAPDVAAEILLACIVDDKPKTEPRGMAMEPRLGLNWEHDDRPTLYWTSPFFVFLRQCPEPALDALLTLVEFCSARWLDDEKSNRPEPLRLVLGDGRKKSFVGNWRVLDWSHTRKAVNSQLFAALDALERWLWMRITEGEDIGDLCAELLERSNSVAIVGVLADCAKLKPALLSGPLKPLLTSPLLILGDDYRLSQRFGNDGFTWYRAGEFARKIGLEWEQAQHRITSLKYVIRDLRRSDPAFDAIARDAITAWPRAKGNFRLRQRALAAELDPANWQEEQGADGEASWRMVYPARLAAAIAAQQPEESAVPTLAMVLGQFEQELGKTISDEQARGLFEAFDEDDPDLKIFSPVEQRIIMTAAATLLVVGAPDWVGAHEQVLVRLRRMIDASVPDYENVADPRDERLEFGPGLAWASVAAIFGKANGCGEPATWDRILSFALAAGDGGLINTVVTAARKVRNQLGASYGAIVEVAVLAAALTALLPRMEGEPGAPEMVARWRLRLAKRALASSKNPETFDLVALAQRIERIWRARYERQSGRPIDAMGRRNLHRRYSLGIGTHLLQATFGWALQDDVPPPTEGLDEHRRVVRMLWEFVDWQLRDNPDEPVTERDGFDSLDNFGLQVLRTISARIPRGDAAASRVLWEPVLALGPRGEFTVEHMIDGLFLSLYKDIDPALFIANWDAMLAYLFEPDWAEGGRYWRAQSILLRMLGLNASHQIASSPTVMAHVASLAPYYEAFAKNHIGGDGSTLANFANFFASEAGAALRIAAIQWIETLLAETTTRLKKNAGSALAELAQALLEHHAGELLADRAARDALNNVIARMVRDQAPYALALQDRARTLR